MYHIVTKYRSTVLYHEKVVSLHPCVQCTCTLCASGKYKELSSYVEYYSCVFCLWPMWNIHDFNLISLAVIEQWKSFGEHTLFWKETLLIKTRMFWYIFLYYRCVMKPSTVYGSKTRATWLPQVPTPAPPPSWSCPVVCAPCSGMRRPWWRQCLNGRPNERRSLNPDNESWGWSGPAQVLLVMRYMYDVHVVIIQKCMWSNSTKPGKSKKKIWR